MDTAQSTFYSLMIISAGSAMGAFIGACTPTALTLFGGYSVVNQSNKLRRRFLS